MPNRKAPVGAFYVFSIYKRLFPFKEVKVRDSLLIL